MKELTLDFYIWHLDLINVCGMFLFGFNSSQKEYFAKYVFLDVLKIYKR